MKDSRPRAKTPRSVFTRILRTSYVIWRAVFARVVMPIVPARKKPGIASETVVLASLSVRARGEGQ
jgi:hypothetical protein